MHPKLRGKDQDQDKIRNQPRGLDPGEPIYVTRAYSIGPNQVVSILAANAMSDVEINALHCAFAWMP